MLLQARVVSSRRAACATGCVGRHSLNPRWLRVQVSAGARHSIALTSQGVVLAWGYNGFGQLGLGDECDRWAPCAMRGAGSGGDAEGEGIGAGSAGGGDEGTEDKAAAPVGRVVEVAAGWWCTLLLVKPPHTC